MTIMLRSKMKKLFLPLLFVFAAAAASSAELPRGEWRCVALTPRVLALTTTPILLRSFDCAAQ